MARAEMTQGDSLDRDPRTPFIYRFQTERYRYVYDVNTSRILRVAPVVWDIVQDFGTRTKEEITDRYGGRHGGAAVAAAYEALARLQTEQGLLLAHRPAHIAMPYDEAWLQKELGTRRQILALGVTERCNFRCAYCVFGGKYRLRRPHSDRVMPWDVARPALDEFLRHSGDAPDRIITFYGGEPLLNLELIRKCVGYARARAGGKVLSFGLSTNGSLLTGAAADFLASERFALMVSLDGPAAVHDRNRRFQSGAPTWDRVVGNVRAFLQRHPAYQTNGLMGLNVVITPPADLPELDAFFQTCDFLTEPINLRAGSVLERDSTYVQDLPPQERRVEGLATLYENYLSALESGRVNAHPRAVSFKFQAAVFEMAFLQFHKRGVSTTRFPLIPDHFCVLPTCIPGASRLFVTTAGDYYICERSSEAAFLRIGSVGEGIEMAKVKRILAEFVNLEKEDCRFCWCLPTCNAGCVLTVMREGQLSRDARRQACAMHRQDTHRTLTSICRVLEKDPRALDYLRNITFS